MKKNKKTKKNTLKSSPQQRIPDDPNSIRLFETNKRNKNYGCWINDDIIPTQSQLEYYRDFLYKIKDYDNEIIFFWHGYKNDKNSRLAAITPDDLDSRVIYNENYRQKLVREFEIVQSALKNERTVAASRNERTVAESRKAFLADQKQDQPAEKKEARLNSSTHSSFSTSSDTQSSPSSPPIVERPISNSSSRSRFSWSSLFPCRPLSPKLTIETKPVPEISLDRLEKIAYVCSHHPWKVDYFWFTFGYSGRRTNKHNDSSQAFRNKLVPDTVAFILEVASKYFTFSDPGCTISRRINVTINETNYKKEMAEIWKKLNATSCTRNSDTSKVYADIINFIKGDDSSLDFYEVHGQPKVSSLIYSSS